MTKAGVERELFVPQKVTARRAVGVCSPKEKEKEKERERERERELYL